MTFVFLGMFVSSSAGEVLFNKEEADILLHRPVSSRDLLWAKIRVLIEVSLWLGGALNLAGFFIGIYATDGGLSVSVHSYCRRRFSKRCFAPVALCWLTNFACAGLAGNGSIR